ncbi:MAG: hypothetical protein M3Y57_18645 [Acidobacteriota bacterium]|nr:hypothetical protein [Acidobacteriota bacterium]
MRAIRVMVDGALGEMPPLFDEVYSELGRPSIAPEKLLRGQLLQMLYSVRSDEPVWDVTVFTKNRDRLLEHNVAQVFFAQVWQQG